MKIFQTLQPPNIPMWNSHKAHNAMNYNTNMNKYFSSGSLNNKSSRC